MSDFPPFSMSESECRVCWLVGWMTDRLSVVSRACCQMIHLLVSTPPRRANRCASQVRCCYHTIAFAAASILLKAFSKENFTLTLPWLITKKNSLITTKKRCVVYLVKSLRRSLRQRHVLHALLLGSATRRFAHSKGGLF